MKVAIIGFGREGRALYTYMTCYQNINAQDIAILDKRDDIDLPEGVRGVLGNSYLDTLDQFDIIYRSPGVPYTHITSRLHSTTKLSSSTKLFFELCPCTIIGVTGTKGKGTTCTLLYTILKETGKDVYLVGNIGHPALNMLPQLTPQSIVIYELSSFQLQDLDRSPQRAVVLDIFPDHQDAHQNYEEYVEAKLNIFKHQKNGDRVFYFNDNHEINRIQLSTPHERRNDIDIKTFNEFTQGDLKIPGEHNLRNAIMAYVVAQSLDINIDLIKKVIFSFTGNEHRLELVGEINDIRYYNDSASTNPQTTLAAARAFREPKILIVGGSDKGLDYSCWTRELPTLNVKMLILMGENKEKIQKTIKSTLPTYHAANLNEAVFQARALSHSGDIVILSPGSASFDMFTGYDDRGRQFKEIVKKMKM